MKLRWPVWTSQCCDCGHVTHYWQKPWYTPRPPDPAQSYLTDLWRIVHADIGAVSLPPIEYSNHVTIHIPRITAVTFKDNT